MPIFDCHSFCSVPCNIQFHYCMQKIITLSVNINDKHELHNKFFIVFNLSFVPRVKDPRGFDIFFLAEDYLFIYPFNKYLVSDYHVFMPGNIAIRMIIWFLLSYSLHPSWRSR